MSDSSWWDECPETQPFYFANDDKAGISAGLSVDQQTYRTTAGHFSTEHNTSLNSF